MEKTLESLSQEAAKLPKEDRLALTRILLELDEPDPRPDNEEKWEKEIQARLKALETGEAETVC